MSKKQISICLIIMLFSGLVMSYMAYESFISDKKIVDSFKKDVIKIRLFYMYENKFNYLHGLWLIPTGIFFVFGLVLLKIPSFSDVKKQIKKDLIKKRKEIRTFKKRL